MDDRKLRRDRCDVRIDARRDAIMAILECAGLNTLTLPEATLSLRKLAASIKVTAPSAVPDEYTKQTPSPDLAKIKEVFGPDNDNLPNWLSVEPERPSLTIRRK